MSELTPAVVAVRDRATGRYLALGAAWTDDAAEALHLGPDAAATVVVRFACEPAALEVVAVEDACRAVA